MITDERIASYIDSFNTDYDPIIMTIRREAEENGVPIIRKEAGEFIKLLMLMNKPENILEIGSAIGYSSIMMASINSDIRITTIERDKDRYDLAVFNIKKYNLDKQINIIYGDAVDTDITGMYDLIFIDAAKGKNIFFFEKYKNNLVKGGTIITDNLSFHGLVEDSDLVKTKNQRGIVNKIKDFISFLDNNEGFATEYISVGDKIAISKRRSDYE
jgi:predicted O-methyltransferase YrrM